MGRLFRLGADSEKIFWISAEATELPILIKLRFSILFCLISLSVCPQHSSLPPTYEEADSLEITIKRFQTEVLAVRREATGVLSNKRADNPSPQILYMKQEVIPLELLQDKAKKSAPAIQDIPQRKEEQKNTLEHESAFAEISERLYMTVGVLSLIGLGILGILFRKLAIKKQQLEKSIGEIQRLNKTRDFFMGIIAHDLRRPLSTLHEMAELADYYIQTNRYESLQKISAYIDQSGAKIRHLLDNMIYWAVSQEGHYQPQTISIASKIDCVLELYSHNILTKQVQLNYECPTCLTAYVDGNGLELIIRNLIDNALKHLPTNGTLCIKATKLSFEAIQIIIADTGPGMLPEKIEQVKYILTHAEELVPGQIGCTLGMLITGRFVILNKGTIRVESIPNQGTTFILTFPDSIG